MRIVICALLAIVTACPAIAQQAYPSRPIRLLLGFPPGGSADLVARVVAPKVAESVKQQIIVDNRSGGRGNIAAGLTIRAEPDGYTLLLGTFGQLAVNPGLYAKPPYDPVRDLATITLLASLMNVIVVHPSVPADTVNALIDLARAKPGYYTYASSGLGGPGHLTGEVFKTLAKIDIRHVPYKGGGPAMADLLGGQVHMMMASVPTAVPHVKAGRVKALGVSSNKRSLGLPDVPTIAEASGLAGYAANQWYVQDWFGVLAPVKTSRAIINRLHAELGHALKQPDVRERLLASGLEPAFTTPEEFSAYLKSETVKWSKIARDAGVTLE